MFGTVVDIFILKTPVARCKTIASSTILDKGERLK